jgi:hypothetical protein
MQGQLGEEKYKGQGKESLGPLGVPASEVITHKLTQAHSFTHTTKSGTSQIYQV